MKVSPFLMFLLLIGFVSAAFTNPTVTYTGGGYGSLTANLPTSLNPTYTESDGVNDGQLCTGQSVFVTPNVGTEWISQGGYISTPPVFLDTARYNSLVGIRDGAGRPWCWPQGGGAFPYPCDVMQQFVGRFSVDAGYCNYLATRGRLPGTCTRYSATSCQCNAFATVLGTGSFTLTNNGALISSQGLPPSGVSVPMSSAGSNTILSTLQVTTFGYIAGAIGVILSNPQFPITLTESRTFNVINPPNGPSLSAVAISVSPTVVTSGQQVNMQVTLRNNGDMDAFVNSFTVSSSPAGFSGNLVPIDGNPVIPIGTQKVFVGTFTAPSVSSQTTFAISGVVSYRSNVVNPCTGQFITPAPLGVNIANVIVNPFVQQFPDLVGAIGFSNSNPSVGDTLTVTVTTSNIGNAQAGPSVTRIASPSGIQDINIGTLNPGGSQPFAFQFTCSQVGTFVFTSTVDVNGQVTESNENNNVQTATITCSPPQTQPDLVGTITFNNNTPNIGDTVNVTVTTSNIGNGQAGPSVTRFIPPSGSQDINIGTLQPGGSQTATFQFVCAAQGTFTFSVTADVNGQVTESNENNNAQIVTLTCGQGGGGQNMTDLIGTITFSNNAPTVGQTVVVTATTSNIGNAPSNASITRIVSPSGTQDVNIGILQPSGSQGFAFNFTCTQAGNFVFTISVDVNGQVTESNENNNAQTITLTCGTGFNLPDLIVSRITLNPITPVAGVQTNITYTIMNNGSVITPNAFLNNLSIDGVLSDEKGIISLAPGASQDLVFQWPASNITQGLHRICALADSKTNVPETNETNNLLCIDVFVAGGGEVCSILADTNPNNLFANLSINYAGLGTITPDWSNITVDCGSPGVGFVNFPPCVGNGTGSCFARCGPYSTSPHANTFKITATIFGRIFCSVQTACVVKV